MQAFGRDVRRRRAWVLTPVRRNDPGVPCRSIFLLGNGRSACNTPWRIVAFLDFHCGFSKAAITTASRPMFLAEIALRQAFRWRSETRHQRFDFRRDLRFADKQKRSIVEKQLAAEPLSARTELDLIRTKSVWSERQAHVAPCTTSTAPALCRESKLLRFSRRPWRWRSPRQ